MEQKFELNLPKTDFPMKADLVAREPQRLAKWESGKLYQRILQRRAGAALQNALIQLAGFPFRQPLRLPGHQIGLHREVRLRQIQLKFLFHLRASNLTAPSLHRQRTERACVATL